MQNHIKTISTIMAAAFLAASSPAMAGRDEIKGPWETGQKASTSGNGSGFDTALSLYQKYVSSWSGHACPMEPSCSAYSKQSFAEDGVVYGFILTADRLLRCGRDELLRGRRIMKNGRVHFFDPVSDNDSTWGALPEKRRAGAFETNPP